MKTSPAALLSLESPELAYMARALVQATLPHSDPGDVKVWSRKNGDLRLSVKPDWKIDEETNEEKCLGVPFGTIPRLLLFWITTEAIRTKSRHLELGPSLSHFMSELGLTPTGGRWGSITRLREQMNRLFRSRISFDYVGPDSNKIDAWMDMQITQEARLWWSSQQPEQATLWNSWIELGELFYKAITQTPVPLNLSILRALKQSPLALDMYAWASYKVFAVNQKSRKQFVPWSGLAEQLGSNYGELNNFRRKTKQSLQKVQAAWPELNINYVNGGLEIYPSSLTVRPLEKPQDN